MNDSLCRQIDLQISPIDLLLVKISCRKLRQINLSNT